MSNIFTEWKQSLATNLDWLDADHKSYLSQFGRLADIAEGSFNSKRLAEAMRFLDDYIGEHFAKEEAEMVKFDYPFTERHQKAHKEFVEKYQTHLKKLQNDDLIGEQFIFFCQNLVLWFYDHIKTEDVELGKYIANLKTS